MSNRSTVRVIALLVLISTALFGSRIHAQVNPHGSVRTYKTAHFRIHFPTELDSLARSAAVHAEEAWRNLSTAFPAPAGPVDLLLQDNVDLTNGFAQTFPSNRITIYVLPPVALAELRFHDDWLRLVITHELTHIFHIDQAHGLWRVGRTIFGRSTALFPNSLLPSWVKEGVAVHFESEFTGSGRIVSTESRTVALAAAHANDIQGLDAWSAATTKFPNGQIPYAWGSLLMHAQAKIGGDSSMRKFANQTSTFPIPFLLNRAAKRGFGRTFSRSFAELRDSLSVAVAKADSSGDAVWQSVSRGAELGLRSAAYPRWLNADSVEWTASNGREVTGLYRAAVPKAGTIESALVNAVRVSRRNSLDVNSPAAALGNGASVYSQYDYRGPYVLRSDLYVHDAHGDRQLTRGARIVQPDVRASDGAIVAVQLLAAATRLVRVSATSGTITPLATDPKSEWTEPRWSPDGTRLTAVQILPTGVQRIVLLDTLGALTHVVAESRAVLATPAFSPNGSRMLWTSDRSGSTQLETADITRANVGVDTLSRADAQVASNVSASVYQPSVSPDGTRVVAMLYRVNGFTIAVSPLDTTGAPVRDSWYANDVAAPDTLAAFVGTSTSYHALRQLIPRYWEPLIGQARDGGNNYGATTSSEDILGRHSYSAQLSLNPRTSEVNGAANYVYAGLGLPVIGVSFSQDWDATFRITDSLGAPLGLIARRLQTPAVSLSWSVPHIRWGANYSVGAQYEMRHFTSDTDALLGEPGSALRKGTRYPTVFVSGGFGTLARGGAGFSAEQGFAVNGSVSLRKREGVADSESWRSVGSLRVFQPLPLPGYARHVLAFRLAGGATDLHAPSSFSVGGTSGVQTDVVPGVSIGDPARTFPIRGFHPGVQRGVRAVAATAEYRAPLSIIARGAGLFPLFLDKLSINAFGDAGRAWCSSTIAVQAPTLCEMPGANNGWLASVGAELNVDLALQYDVPYRLRFGFAKPVAAPFGIARRPSLFVTLGSFF
ncbi:MAG: hypothetical protein ABJB66_07920 [Gemmatimonadaceae bacterium]